CHHWASLSRYVGWNGETGKQRRRCKSARRTPCPPTQGTMTAETIEIRECTTVAEFDACISLQREAFGLPDQELSPRRHLIVSRQAGGWTLAAFSNEQMVGFVHHLAAANGNEVFGYS